MATTLVVHPPSNDKIGVSQKRGVPCQRFYRYEP
jgi:hypothetical protein